MRVLFLGPKESPIVTFLISQGEEVQHASDLLVAEKIKAERHEFLISYGYRHILRKDILELFPNRAINLHISFLPWNRGADPNLWSFIENTPKGVTIHDLDEGIDTGAILFQKEVKMESQDTLASSYAKLKEEIEKLFMENWAAIRSGMCQRKNQPTGGSVHRLKDKEKVLYLLTDGWDTSVEKLSRKQS
jgi:methionyl-tRNA formyltransferase